MKRPPRSVLQLTPRMCRWPCGDPGEPEFFFCGAAKHPGFPYCLEHCCLAYLYFRRKREAAA